MIIKTNKVYEFKSNSNEFYVYDDKNKVFTQNASAPIENIVNVTEVHEEEDSCLSLMGGPKKTVCFCFEIERIDESSSKVIVNGRTKMFLYSTQVYQVRILKYESNNSIDYERNLIKDERKKFIEKSDFSETIKRRKNGNHNLQM